MKHPGVRQINRPAVTPQDAWFGAILAVPAPLNKCQHFPALRQPPRSWRFGNIHPPENMLALHCESSLTGDIYSSKNISPDGGKFFSCLHQFTPVMQPSGD
ncbi:hypothetical protein A6M21_01635 [Desulfotomaculum copahuensis]|uniref:Uncharacterized protein n=1 Tax=Desulfotomaculum copahuensis TaxID=1838280 RepID=A0A1B7LKE5_9FIRM|nr:hypothetical protein A6M21_01635 [Desulfotomaculum copahuensis]